MHSAQVKANLGIGQARYSRFVNRRQQAPKSQARICGPQSRDHVVSQKTQLLNTRASSSSYN